SPATASNVHAAVRRRARMRCLAINTTARSHSFSSKGNSLESTRSFSCCLNLSSPLIDCNFFRVFFSDHLLQFFPCRIEMPFGGAFRNVEHPGNFLVHVSIDKIKVKHLPAGWRQFGNKGVDLVHVDP